MRFNAVGWLAAFAISMRLGCAPAVRLDASSVQTQAPALDAKAVAQQFNVIVPVTQADTVLRAFAYGPLVQSEPHAAPVGEAQI